LPQTLESVLFIHHSNLPHDFCLGMDRLHNLKEFTIDSSDMGFDCLIFDYTNRYDSFQGIPFHDNKNLQKIVLQFGIGYQPDTIISSWIERVKAHKIFDNIRYRIKDVSISYKDSFPFVTIIMR
jgi:hypothetical protein